jgi:hypothetical protein
MWWHSRRKHEHDEPELRPLTEREHEILTFLLSVDFPGVEKLREQAQTAEVSWWCRGDPSIGLAVHTSLAADDVSCLVEADGRRGTYDPAGPLALSVDDGLLENLFYDGPKKTSEFPAPDQFNDPVVHRYS